MSVSDARFLLVQRLLQSLPSQSLDLTVTTFNDLHPLFAAYEAAVVAEAHAHAAQPPAHWRCSACAGDIEVCPV